MARSDLLISLVKAAAGNDKTLLKSAVEALAAEERAKAHNTLADRLQRALQVGSHTPSPTQASASVPATHGREFISEITPRKTLNDLILPEIVRVELDAMIEEQLRTDVLRASGLVPRHRLLLAGPPGNGKTSVAESVAEALAVPLFVVRYDSLIGSFLGETSTRLRRLFEYVRTVPCVLLFDEFDTIGKERGDTHETGEIKRVVSSLLMQIDTLPSYVVVVAATNHRELLDRAVWRRFELRLELPAPSMGEIATYLDRVFSQWPEVPFVRGEELSQSLGSLSYAEAEDFCLDVRRRYVLSNKASKLDSVVRDRMIAWKVRIRPDTDGSRSEQAVVKTKRSASRNTGARSSR